jgi:hypothetical protein
MCVQVAGAKKNPKSFMRRIMLAATVWALVAPSVFASLASCSTSTATSSAIAGSQIAGAPIAAAGPGNDFATLGTAPVTGCQGTDINFQNLTETNGAPAGGSGNYISTLSNQDLTAGTVTAIFSTVRGADAQSGGGHGDAGTNDGTNNWVGSATFTTNYNAAATSTGFFQVFALNLDGVQLGAAGTAGTAGTVTGTVSLCFGGTWSGAVCSSGNSHTINLVSGTNSYSFAFNSVTQIGIQNSFTLTNGSGTGSTPTFITSFTEAFSEAPEPCTFALFGTAIAGLAFWRRARLSR